MSCVGYKKGEHGALCEGILEPAAVMSTKLRIRASPEAVDVTLHTHTLLLYTTTTQNETPQTPIDGVFILPPVKDPLILLIAIIIHWP